MTTLALFIQKIISYSVIHIIRFGSILRLGLTYCSREQKLYLSVLVIFLQHQEIITGYRIL